MERMQKFSTNHSRQYFLDKLDMCIHLWLPMSANFLFAWWINFWANLLCVQRLGGTYILYAKNKDKDYAKAWDIIERELNKKKKTQTSRSNESPVEKPPVGNFCLNDYWLLCKTFLGFCLMHCFIDFLLRAQQKLNNVEIWSLLFNWLVYQIIHTCNQLLAQISLLCR